MSRLISVMLLAVLALTAWGARASDSPGALARLVAAGSMIEEDGSAYTLQLELTQGVPWRVFTLDDPKQLVLDFSDVAWPGRPMAAVADGFAVQTGRYAPGWSRMIVDLPRPFGVEDTRLSIDESDGRAVLSLRLTPISAPEFSQSAGPPPALLKGQSHAKSLRQSAEPPRSGVLRIALDAGHGGRDSGARAGGLREADLMLTFARELREVLLRGGFDVAMTRDEDVFVPLETRISIAKEAKADVFLSLHADSLPEGEGNASGATVYTLAEDASDQASQRIAERHGLSDQLAGVNLEGQSDEIAMVLMDIARTETAPRSDNLADALVTGLKNSIARVNSRPRRQASFSVLKAPDMPSALIELGFLSSERDRANLIDPAWRRQAAEGILAALRTWDVEDRMQSDLLRQ